MLAAAKELPISSFARNKQHGYGTLENVRANICARFRHHRPQIFQPRSLSMSTRLRPLPRRYFLRELRVDSQLLDGELRARVSRPTNTLKQQQPAAAVRRGVGQSDQCTYRSFETVATRAFARPSLNRIPSSGHPGSETFDRILERVIGHHRQESDLNFFGASFVWCACASACFVRD